MKKLRVMRDIFKTFMTKLLTCVFNPKSSEYISYYSSNVKRSIRKTKVLGVRLSVPNGAYAVTAGAGGGNTTRVAAAFRAKVGMLASVGLRTGFNTDGPIAGTGRMRGKKGLFINRSPIQKENQVEMAHK